MGIKLEYRGFTFEFAKIPSSEELEERYRQRVESLQSASRKLQEDKIQPVERDGFLPTTSLQERFWYMHEASGGGVALHISHIVWLGGDLDVKALEGAFATVIERHEILRTGFQRTEAGLVHVVDDGIRFHLDEIDVRAQYQDGGKAALHRTIGKVIDVAFELDEPPLIRGSILHLGPNLYALVMVMHHIAGDGWSLRLLLQEVLAFYKAGVERKELEFPELPIQFADFAAWQVSRRKEAETASALSYWVDQLADSEPLDLPTDRPRPATRSHRGATYRFDLPQATVTALRRFVDGRDATLFHVLLGAFQVLLARYSGTRDVSVGSVVSGRNRPEVEDLIGCFINNMVLRTDLGGGISVEELMQRVRKTVTDAQSNEVPFDWIVHELRRDRNIQEKPLFRVMLIQDEFPDMRGEVAGLEILGSEPWYPGAHYDMTLFVEAGEAHIAFVLRYATEIFDESTIAALAASYLRILEQFVASPQRAVADLDILDVEAQDALIARGRGPELAVGERLIHQRFEDRVAAQADRVAVSFEGGSWTYAELNQRANRIAQALIERGVGPDTFVGVSVERTPQLLTALLGVMKAGGAYVALQPDFPPERFRYIAADARIAALVCTRATANEQAWEGDRVVIEEVEAAAQGEAANPLVELDAENLAYVLYTSGTTGRPKGVEMRHGAVSALVAALEYLAHIQRKRAVTFLVSAALLVPARPRAFEREPSEGTFKSIGEGIRYVVGVPPSLPCRILILFSSKRRSMILSSVPRVG